MSPSRTASAATTLTSALAGKATGTASAATPMNASARGETSIDAQANATAATGTAAASSLRSQPLSTDDPAQAPCQCSLDRDLGGDHGDGHTLGGGPEDGRVLRASLPPGEGLGGDDDERHRAAAPTELEQRLDGAVRPSRSRRRSRGRARSPSTGIAKRPVDVSPCDGHHARQRIERDLPVVAR